MSGIYIHIPFCSDFCTYCNFYSVRDGSKMRTYVDAVKKEIDQKRDFFDGADSPPATIYFGGGSPSSMPVGWLAEIAEYVIKTFNPDIKEFTVEVNPENINRNLLNELKAMGVNRLSMGVQSFDDEALVWMNRRHDSQDVIDSFNLIRKQGFDNVNLDLIFGYGMLTNEIWKDNLDKMIELTPEHISAYQMGIEKESELFEMLSNGEYIEPEEERSVAQYSMLQKSLIDAGYLQYEVSNFAKEGYRAKHNSSYWDRSPYLGLGPSAHSFQGNVREWNVSYLDKYLKALLRDEPNRSYIRRENLSPKDIFNESLMLGLRRIEGVDLQLLDQNLIKCIMPQIKRDISESLLEYIGDSDIRIPSDKLFISDSIIGNLFV